MRLSSHITRDLHIGMNVCAVTMVYKDRWALSQWYRHYGQLVGFENLYVVTHGPDATVREACPEAQVLQVPRESLEQFDNIRGRMLNHFQDGLNQYYDWVIRTDADELICFDPNLYASIYDVLAKIQSGAVFALGFDLFEFEEDAPLTEDQPALGHRRNAVFSGHYSKAWAVRNRIGMKRHGAKMRAKIVPGFSFEMPHGVFLAHLKYANGDALFASNEVRHGVANQIGKGLPGLAWREADKSAVKAFRRARSLPILEWDTAVKKAWDALQEPIRDPEIGVVRARSQTFPFRTLLPGWFGR
ncbi:MAG: glycosyltransferase family 2 protein [Paracoccaceae bacterium]